MSEPAHEFTLFADYFQFYIQDESAEADLSAAWTEEAVERMLAVEAGVVGIGTARNMHVPVSVEVLDAAPPPDLARWEHVVDCTLVTRGAKLAIAGCTDYLPDAARIAVAPGTYRVRASYAGLDTLSDDGLEGQDRYRLQLWPAPAIGVTVVKQRAA
jgi:hypothetical protein